MARNVNFVFLDLKDKRWKIVKKNFKRTLFILEIIVVFVFLCFSSTPAFGSDFITSLGKSRKEIVDEISTAKEDVIEVLGDGPILKLQKNKGNGLYLEKESSSHKKIVVLTFDDGPDPKYTPQILDVLKKEKVPAVFFVIGKQLVRHPLIAERILQEGHQIGLHTYSHPDDSFDLYKKVGNLSQEMDFPQKILESQTGYKSRIFRIPNWGAEDTISMNSLVLSIEAMNRGYIILPPNLDSFDWLEGDVGKIVSNSIGTRDLNIILLHDGGGDRSKTVSALPQIISRYKSLGYSFSDATAVADTTFPLLEKLNFWEKFIADVSVSFDWLKRNFFSIQVPVFEFSLGVIVISTLAFLTLSFCHFTRGFLKKSQRGFQPFVSVIVPALNEENSIAKTINSLLKSDYPRFEIIVVDNGSLDATAGIVKKFLKFGKVKLVWEGNRGKYNALNTGIKDSLGRIIVAIDADTQVLPDTIREIIKPFQNPKIGAVSGNLKVGNVRNSLTALQSIEYTVGLNIDRRAYDILGACLVVPGALGAWRKSAVKSVGGYKGDTLTEDSELTVRLQKKGYKVVFCDKAVGFTEAPENLKDFIKQRSRWTFGVIQVLYKYRGIYFKRRYGILSMVVLPFMALIQLPVMLIAPVVDLMALSFVIFVSPHPVIEYFFGFLLVYSSLVLLAFFLAKEKRIWLLLLLPLQRIFYQSIWYYVLYRAIIAALKGIFVPWAKLVHLGTVTLLDDKIPAIETVPKSYV